MSSCATPVRIVAVGGQRRLPSARRYHPINPLRSRSGQNAARRRNVPCRSFDRWYFGSSRLLSSLPTVAEPRESALTPIDFDTSSRIAGQESQLVEVQLREGQLLRAESGAMVYMTSGISMEATLGAGGVGDGFRRALTGQNVFVTDFTYKPEEDPRNEGSGMVALGTDFPSKILQMNLADYQGKLVCQKGAYLASSSDVAIEMEFAKSFSAGFFGGEGFILQGLVGDGTVFIKGGGTIVTRHLEDGEVLRVSSGCIVAFTRHVQYDVQMMPGFRNVLFGGEGLFVTTLQGPGTIWLQGMPPDRMVSEISRRIPGSAGIPLGVPIGLGGGGGGGNEDADAADADEGATTADGGEGDASVAATDASVEADRQATVASSGLGTDSDSPSSLFGDAAGEPRDATATSAPPMEDSFGTAPDLQQDDSTMSSSSSSSDFFDDADETANNEEFVQDETEFTTFDGDDDGGGGGGGDDEEGGGGVSSILRTLWRIFSDDDD